MFLAHLWPWNKAKTIKPKTANVDHAQGHIMQSWKDLGVKKQPKKKPL